MITVITNDRIFGVLFLHTVLGHTVWEVALVCIKRKGCENSFFSSLLPTDEGSTCHQKGAFTYLVLPDAKKFTLFAKSKKSKIKNLQIQKIL